MINIINYENKYHDDFRSLNLEWLQKYNLAETHDLEILNDPDGMILNTGGVIYLAEAGGEIVGTAALIKEGEETYELAKMAVTREWQGKGISKMLIEKCLDMARQLHAKRITLYSNSQLATALQLYKKYGFKDISAADSPYITADVRMELNMEDTLNFDRTNTDS